MRIKLPSKNLLRKLMLGAFGLLLLCIAVSVVVAFVHGGEMWLLPVWVGAIGLAVMLPMLPLLIVLLPFMSKAEINHYKYIEFTDSYVILIHKDPALTRNLPYDQTDLSLTFFTALTERYCSISHLTLSFSQKETFSISLKGPWFVHEKFIRQLLDNAKRFKHFEFVVVPGQDKEVADVIQQQIQEYLIRGWISAPSPGRIPWYYSCLIAIFIFVIGIIIMDIDRFLAITCGTASIVVIVSWIRYKLYPARKRKK